MTDKPRRPKGVSTFDDAAGGWAALKAASAHLREQQVLLRGHRTLLAMNKPEGFDCPGCAWPDKNPHGSFEYCENGAKAIAWESTRKRADPSLFAKHSVGQLLDQSDHWLEDQGRLTDPLRYNPNTDHYEPVAWDTAFRDIGHQLSSLDDPNKAEFYTSGRTSNEAAFLLQLLARSLGTNNFPDCSNLCHEASSVGLPQSIGVGKGTVTLDDFEQCDAIFSFGHNPATNHPRMLGVLRDAAQRGAKIVVFNPLRERGLEKFRDPQSVGDMLTGQSTLLATHYYQLKVGGDIAAIHGLIKALLENNEAIDTEFIATHTHGFSALRASLEALSWDAIEQSSGLTRQRLRESATLYAEADRTIIAYGMGITQHRHGTSNVQALANLALVRGNIGRPGAGICPVRGHSNVQGDRTMGIWEKPTEAFLNKMEAGTGVSMPCTEGHTVVETIAAMRAGSAQVFFAMGGNMVSASPDPKGVMDGLRQQILTVSVATKLNRSHLAPGKTAYLLPCLGRTELDQQNGEPQVVTVEDSMSMVHASKGVNAPASPLLQSECRIVAEIAHQALPNSPLDWPALADDYSRIRNLIASSIEGFQDFETRIETPGGFHLPNAARERRWLTPSGKAQFLAIPLPKQPHRLYLTTLRSHDQYNTSIYGYDDRYRGIRGRRDVLFMNVEDMAAMEISEGLQICLVNAEEPTLQLDPLTVVRYDLPAGCCATYFPEANVLIPATHYDSKSSTPGYKSLPVRVEASSLRS